jgi:3-hydroxybutyryl-CoA dehydrogenase
MKEIGVVGAGQMGNGIAQVAAQKGYQVILSDINQDALELALNTIGKNCDRLIKKEKMNADEKAALLNNIKTTTQLNDLSQCDCVIEAATENVDLKLNILKQLDDICKAETLLCSNTSSISITKMAAATKRPAQVCGMHFMNPVPVMKLVEGIRGLQTSDDTFKKVSGFTETLDKVFVEANDRPGFIVNRILMPMINEAIFTLSEGIANEEDIDQAMKLGTNQPMGPLALADLIGLDTCLAIMNVLHEGLGESKYRPCPLLVKYVEAGWLGRKTARGFYTYEN